MLTIVQLEEIAKARIDDAEILYSADRYDGAIYLCGYAVEVALKARICKTLNWAEFFPDREKNLQSFKTHKLEVLLKLSGVESVVIPDFLADWSFVVGWDPESRYKPIGSAKQDETLQMISSARAVMGVL